MAFPLMLSADDIREALRACFTSANPYGRSLNVVDLGLIEGISLALDPYAPGAGIAGVPPRQSLMLTLIAASPDEDAISVLRAQAENRLAGLPGLSSVMIQFLDSPAWTPTRVTPAGRRLLNLDPPVFTILNSR